ncbi:AraC family transcriptional regulator [Thalassospira sp. MA62]|nr:AraC family transcriptional regulator [Thalassospira sp. MA62]
MRGCVGCSVLPNDVTLYRAELKALEDSEIAVTPPETEPNVLFGKYLVGETLLKVPPAQVLSVSPQVTLIKRVDQLVSHYAIAKGQTVRYTAAMIPVRVLLAQITPDVIPTALLPFLEDGSDICNASLVASNRKMHNLATRLFMAKPGNIAQNLVMSGLSSMFIGEIISAFCGSSDRGPDAVVDWEIHVFADLKSYIDANLGHALSRAALAAKFDISESNLNRLFVRYAHQSYGDYVREKRLEAAHLALGNTHMSVSQVAQSVGYNHVSNFSRAYRKRFGEMPSRAMQRSRS